ncbi:MAG TPA: hypothetical protein PLY40_07120 [Bacillota bacterium]|nr:hypothetical protein [Bacillota bacterium]
MSVLGAAAIMAAPVLAWRQVERRSTGILILAETGLWLALVVMAAGNPRLLYRSALATIQNLALDSGGWGVFPVLLGALLVAVLAFTDIPDRVYLRFPVTAFIPLAFMLAYFREGSYRVGPGDSLNRMLLHIMPLAILLVVSAAASPYWGLPRKNRK